MADRTQEQLIDELLKEYKGPESFWDESGIFVFLMFLKKSLVNVYFTRLYNNEAEGARTLNLRIDSPN